MRLKFFIFSLFLALSSGVYAMEEQPAKTSMLEETIAIRCSDGQIIGVPKNVAFKAAAIYNYLTDSFDAVIPIEEKESSHHAGYTVDLANTRFLKSAGKKADPLSLDLGADTLKKMFDCCIHENVIQHLNKEEVVAVFEAGHCLGIPRKTLSTLTFHAQNILPSKEQPKLIKLGHYVNSIGSLYNNGFLKVVCRFEKYDHQDLINGVMQSTLYIKDQDIETVDGIELVAKVYEHSNQYVVRLVISGNQLKIFDVDKLLNVFPVLKEIHAENNDIEKLIMPQQLPQRFMLFLNNNNIKELPYFKLGEDGHIDLQNNPLSIRAKNIVEHAARLNLLQQHRHRLKALQDSQMVEKTMIGCFVGVADAALMPLIAFFESSSSFIIKTPIIKYGNPAVWKNAMLYGLNHVQEKRSFMYGIAASYILGGTAAGLYWGYDRSYPNAVANYKYQPATFVVDQK